MTTMNRNPTGRRTATTPAEYPLAWHAALQQPIGGARAIACEEREGAAKALAGRYRKFLARLRQDAAHPSAQFANAPDRQVVVTIRRSLLGWMVVVEIRALPAIEGMISQSLPPAR